MVEESAEHFAYPAPPKRKSRLWAELVFAALALVGFMLCIVLPVLGIAYVTHWMNA